MDEQIQRIRQKTNELNDSIQISCADFKYVIDHFLDETELLNNHKAGYKRLAEKYKSALEDIQRYNKDYTTNDRRIRFIIKEITNKALGGI